MTLNAHEFMRRFLIHVLPKGLHRIRHYGLFASGAKARNLDHMRELLGSATATNDAGPTEDAGREMHEETDDLKACPCCGGRMEIIEVFSAGEIPRHIATVEGIDSS